MFTFFIEDIQIKIQGYSQALSSKDSLQPEVSIYKGNEEKASQPVPPSGLKQILNPQRELSLRPQTADHKAFEVGCSSSGNTEKIQKLKDFQKRKVAFSIEKPSHPWEKEYFDFAKIIYELKQGETFLRISDKNIIYPKISCLPNSSSKFVKKLADYGFLDRLYPSTDLKELNEFSTDF